MKKRLLLYTTLALAVFSAISCKKDEEETVVKPYLYGLEFDLATFARPGQTFTLKPYGVFYTEDEPGVEKFTPPCAADACMPAWRMLPTDVR